MDEEDFLLHRKHELEKQKRIRKLRREVEELERGNRLDQKWETTITPLVFSGPPHYSIRVFS